MLAVVYWSRLNRDQDSLWDLDRGLYAYLAPPGREIVYIGKVDGTTVRQRWNRSGKQGFWDDLETEKGIFRHAVLAGEIDTEDGSRLTRQLLADIESLLIKRVNPWGNIQSRHFRISRPGLRIVCDGSWPLEQREFRDR